jgi:hypothetical protein
VASALVFFDWSRPQCGQRGLDPLGLECQQRRHPKRAHQRLDKDQLEHHIVPQEPGAPAGVCVTAAGGSAIWYLLFGTESCPWAGGLAIWHLVLTCGTSCLAPNGAHGSSTWICRVWQMVEQLHSAQFWHFICVIEMIITVQFCKSFQLIGNPRLVIFMRMLIDKFFARGAQFIGCDCQARFVS